MAKIIRYTVVALVLFATWQGAMAQWQQFQLEDAVKQLARFAEDRDEGVIMRAVLAEGNNHGLELDPEKVTVHRDGDHVTINIVYTRLIQILPGYHRSWTFTVKAEGSYIPGGRIRK